MMKKQWAMVAIVAGLTTMVTSVQAGPVLTVNPQVQFQTVEGFGGASPYFNGTIRWHPQKQAIYDTIFNGLGLSYLRIANASQDRTRCVKGQQLGVWSKGNQVLPSETRYSQTRYGDYHNR